jgi:recombinational DNA repair protein RecR
MSGECDACTNINSTEKPTLCPLDQGDGTTVCAFRYVKNIYAIINSSGYSPPVVDENIRWIIASI